jgi:hypothetical protein
MTRLLQAPDGWQFLSDYCRTHKLPYQRCYRRVMEGIVDYDVVQGAIIVRKWQSTTPFARKTRPRKQFPSSSDGPFLYNCGAPDCVYGIYGNCPHKRGRK